jgi:hypothetical protein
MAEIISSPDVIQPETVPVQTDPAAVQQPVPAEVAAAVAAVEAAPLDLDKLAQKSVDEAGEIEVQVEAPPVPRITFDRTGPNGSIETCDSVTGEVVDRRFVDG